MTDYSSYYDYYNALRDRLRHSYDGFRNRDASGGSRSDRGSRGLAAADPLEVDLVHFYPLENARRHHTDRFELVLQDENPTPVLRRGATFFMVIRFKRQTYDKHKHDIRLVFDYGPRPTPLKFTQARLQVTGSNSFPSNDGGWAIRLTGSDKNMATVEVQISGDAYIGIWRCTVETSEKNSSKPNVYRCPEDIYILFNPWSKDDPAYFADESLLDEYLINDVGKIWVGPYGSSRGRHWVYGQYDDTVLPTIMLIFERANLPFTQRGNPIQISRALTKMVNSNDDGGIVQGRWDGEYSDGTAPAAWTGSVPILEEYFKTQKPVKYGQCWVFSGVLTTVCRALGLPARPVSNLVSAHDANMSLTVDKYFDENNEALDYDPHNPSGNKDSIWNFHVWTEVWMARPDLPTGYGGWQVIDATPQEVSEGFFQCGPASVEAVRRGEVGFAYDVPFVLAEVNADLVRWKVDSSSVLGFTKMDSNKYHVGRMILTKKPEGAADEDGDRDDITASYKDIEGSHMERLALYNAVRGTPRAKRFFEFPASSSENDVEFDLIDIDRVPLGQPFHMIVDIVNNSSNSRRVHSDLTADSVYYTGIKAHSIQRSHVDFVVQPNSREQMRVEVSPDTYMDKLVEYCIIKIGAIATVEETKQTWSEEDDFQILKPDLEIEIPEKIIVNRPTPMSIRFKNPLSKRLTRCEFRLEGPGLIRSEVIRHRNVLPDESIVFKYTVQPSRSGFQRLVATFASRELIDIVGSATVNVIA